jgi:hypothetical protein
MDWIDLAQDREKWWVLVNKIMNRSIKCWEVLSSYATGGFTRRAQLHEVSHDFGFRE